MAEGDTLRVVFHIQLRQSVNISREFNLSAEELHQRILVPWKANALVVSGDKKWAPERAKLTIYEGPELRPDEIGMGRGWGNVTKHGTDVTGRLLAATAPAPASASAPPAGADAAGGSELDRCRQEIVRRAQAGAIALGACIEIAGSLRFGSRVSERFALAEQAVWELLHMNAIELHGDDLGPGAGTVEWQRVLLDWDAWSGAKVVQVRAPAA
jgi:hypothetical protein